MKARRLARDVEEAAARLEEFATEMDEAASELEGRAACAFASSAHEFHQCHFVLLMQARGTSGANEAVGNRKRPRRRSQWQYWSST
jgi:hypothetical protein